MKDKIITKILDLLFKYALISALANLTIFCFIMEALSRAFFFCCWCVDYFIGCSAVAIKFFINFIFNKICDLIEYVGKITYWNREKEWNVFLDSVEHFFHKLVNYLDDKLSRNPVLFLFMAFITIGLFILAVWDFFFNFTGVSIFSNLIQDLSWYANIHNFFSLNKFWILFTYFFLALYGGYKYELGENNWSFLLSIGAREIAFSVSVFIFFIILVLIYGYDTRNLFTVLNFPFLSEHLVSAFPSLFFAVDALSLSFALLVGFIFPIIILTAWEKVLHRNNFFYFNVILLEICVLGAFFTLDLFLFFVFFEAMFIPMSFIILLWGSRQRKVKATSYIFLYTIFGSAFFLTGIIFLYVSLGTTNYFEILMNLHRLSKFELYFLWVAFFIPFAIKIPMFPFHIWLPEAHVEAPTSGSIALAAIMLKLGGYGFIRFLIPLFYEPSLFFSPLVNGLAIVGVIYGSFAAIRQTDIKKIIAYSSIAHMNLVVLGIFSFNINSLYGALVLMIGHGLVSSALFFLAGILYDRYHTRSTAYYSGLVQVMPVFSVFFIFFVAANFGFPCSISFVGELLIYLGVYKQLGAIITFIMGFSSIIGVYLNMMLFISVCFGPLSKSYNNIYQDLSARELKIIVSLALVSLIFFIFNSTFFSIITSSNSLYFHFFV